MLAKGNPQWPQVTNEKHQPPTPPVTTNISPGFLSHGKCRDRQPRRDPDCQMYVQQYGTQYCHKNRFVQKLLVRFTDPLLFAPGHTGGDEMCNLYLMFYTLTPEDDFVVCVDEQNSALTSQLPPGSDVPLPPNPLLEHSATEETPLSYDNGQGEAGLQPPVKRPDGSVRKRPGVAINGDYDSYNAASPSITDLVDAPDTNTDEGDGFVGVQPRSTRYQSRCVTRTILVFPRLG